MEKIKVLGVCGAQGALLFPLRKFLIGNVEPRGVFHTPKEEQWKLNFGEIPFVRDFEPFKGNQVDVIIGSPSCGHSSVFSYSRKKTLGKPREDASMNLFVSSIQEFQPKVFLMENLPKLLSLIPLDEWEETFESYRLIVHAYPVISFGNSQKSRKRMVLIGIRKDSGIKAKYFEKVFEVSTPQLVKDLGKQVRKELNYHEDDSKVLAMYDYRDKERKNLTVKQVRHLWRGDFKDEYKWPMKGTRMNTLPGVYRNRAEAYPLTVRPSSRQFNPNGQIMGLEDYRIIMGFPEKFQVYFEDTPEKRNYWLNKGRNTLTKGACYEVGLWFRKCLKRAF